MSLQSPAPSKHHPWYTHCNLPDRSILPSDSGASRWGQRSLNTCHRSSARSHHTTTSSPNTRFAWGTLLSKSHTGARGYQFWNQSNFSADGSFSTSVSWRPADDAWRRVLGKGGVFRRRRGGGVGEMGWGKGKGKVVSGGEGRRWGGVGRRASMAPKR